MKVLGNAAVFVMLYILFMLPTYYLPYLGSNSAIVGALGAAAGAGVNPAFWPHLGSLIILIIVTWFRGTLVDKKWLIIFPILATVFDLAPALNSIPLIPTVMHLFAIILGVAGAEKAAATQARTLKPDVISATISSNDEIHKGGAVERSSGRDVTPLPAESQNELLTSIEQTNMSSGAKVVESPGQERVSNAYGQSLSYDPGARMIQSPSVASEVTPNSFTVTGAPPSALAWVIPGVLAALVTGGILYYQSIQHEAEQRAMQERLVLEQERTRQNEEESRQLAERLARLEAGQEAQAKPRYPEAEMDQQSPVTASIPGDQQVSGPISAEPPTIYVGDRYTYETLDFNDSRLNNVTTREIIESSNGVYTQRNVNNKSGYTRFIRYDASWNILGSGTQAGDESHFRPALKYFDFPLRVGKTWEGRSTETNTKTGATRTHWVRAKVEGQEKVTVPAGTFDTFKIVLDTETIEGNKRLSGTDVSWYAPEARRTVRSELSDTGKQGKRVVQLLSYELR